MKNTLNTSDWGNFHAQNLVLIQPLSKLKRGSLALGLTLTLFVGGCSSLPGYANLGNWYEEASGTVSGWVDSVKGSWSQNINGDWLADMPTGWIPSWLGGTESAEMAEGGTLVGDSANARYIKSMNAAENPSLALAVKNSQASNLWPRKPAPGTAALLGNSSAQTPPAVTKTRTQKVLINPVLPKKVAAAAQPQARTAVVTNAQATVQAVTKRATAPVSAAAALQAAQQRPQKIALEQKFSLKKFFADEGASSDRQERTMNFGNLLGTSDLPSASEQGVEPMSAVIYFANGSSQVTAKGRAIVAKLVAMARDENSVIRVIGHASRRTRDMDPVKHKLVNLNVSVQRANAVVAELVRRGVPRTKIEAVARGASMPMYLEIMPAGEAGNRRVEIFVERLS